MRTFNLLLISLCFITQAESTNLFGSKGQHCNDCPMYGGYFTCNSGTCDLLLLNGYWAGNMTPGGEQLVASCPLGYCLINDSSPFIWIPQSMAGTIGDFLCNATHRMGVICGQCQPGYAPAINSDSSDCVPCSEHSFQVNWVYYILGVYVPLLVVFLVIIMFNVRLTTGPLNSFILFAQVISTTVSISQQGVAPLYAVYGKGASVFQSAYEIPYNFFNLNLFGNVLPPFCLHRSLDTLDVIALRYLEAFFPVCIIIVIVLLLRCQRCIKVSAKLPSCLQKYRVGGYLVQAFAAFILLSYNRVCEITAYLLTPTEAFDDTLKIVESRVYLQGDYSINDRVYIARYKVPAYLITVILIAVPITLLHYPMKCVELMISKLSWLRNLYPSAEISILLDTFQGCFKDNRRYFAGLYMILRLLLFFAFFQPWQLQLLIQQILFIIYIFLLAFLKPYNDNRLNYLDTAMFINLALINGLSWYTVTVMQTGSRTFAVNVCIVFESILVFLPMIYLFAYLFWYSTRRYHKSIKATVNKWYHKKRISPDQETHGDGVSHTPEKYFSDEDFDVLVRRAIEHEEKQYGTAYPKLL